MNGRGCQWRGAGGKNGQGGNSDLNTNGNGNGLRAMEASCSGMRKPSVRKVPQLPGRQRGMVLILIVFIVALVTILAAGLSTKQSLDIRRGDQYC